MKLSAKIAEVQPSATLAITSKAKAMRAAGEDVIILAAGEPDFDTPEIVKQAAIKAIQDGFTKYTPSSGTKSLKEAVCKKFDKDNSLKYDPSEIVISNGAKHSLYNVLQVICNPGDEVLVVSPYWVSYPEMAKLAGAVPRLITTKRENNFKVTAEEIKSSISSKTRVLILNSPSNPAGVVYDDKELAAIAEVCLSKGILIISDEIYEEILYDGKKHFSIAAVSDDVKASTIVVNGVSKSYSMTGWRIGYLAADKKIVGMINTLQSHATSNPCSISQVAAECALTSDLKDELEANREKFEGRRNKLIEMLEEDSKLKPFKPEGAFYLFCDISAGGLDSFTFAERLLEKKKVAVIPGGPFGDDRYVRISFATDLDTIKEGVSRIREWMGEL